MDRRVNLKGTVTDNEDNEEGDNQLVDEWVCRWMDGWMDGCM